MPPSRRSIALAIVVTIAIGGASRIVPLGIRIWDKSAGDIAYAVMVAFIVLFARPRAHPIAIGALAIAICFALELFQLTGIPARQPRVLQIVLGKEFAWHDMACYVIGGGVAMVLIDRLFSRPASSESHPST